MTDQPVTLNLTLHPDGVSGPMQLSARKAAQILTIALPAIADHNFKETVEVGPPQTVYAFPALDLPDGEEQRELEAWLVGSVLHELTRGIRRSLEEAFLYTRVFALDGQLLRGDAISRIQEEAAKCHTPVLLELVNGLLSEPLAFANELDALNRARNCLEHGRGVVRPRDCGPEETVMRLLLPYFALVQVLPDGSLADVVFGERMEAETRLQMERRTHTFEFPVGEPLRLSVDQLHAAIIGCVLFAMDLAGKLPVKEEQKV